MPMSSIDLPWLTTQQMVEVDRAMMEELLVEQTQMMENAGSRLARLAVARFLGGDPRGKSVVALAGSGGNGGGVLVAVRRLAGWGAEARVVLTRAPQALTAVPAQQLEILRRLEIPLLTADAVEESDGLSGGELILDGLIGYSLRGAPRGRVANLIRWANLQPAPTLALDTPSGVDATTGTVFQPAITAAATLTLALPKQGLRAAGAEGLVGELYLADIGVPPSLYARALGLEVGPIFAREEILRLR